VVGVGEPDLPGVEREIQSISKASGAARVLAGPAATRAAVAHSLATARVVHLAGHGWEAEEAPPLGGVRVADGWFTAADLPADGVTADLVVLAACRTGRTRGHAGVAWGGLVTALISAGARRVLWTTDDVDDAATARLMTLFHEARRSGDDRSAFGSALARGAVESGHAGSVLAFRLSGVPS
jgi:CHAT domain-containing protein